MSIRLCKQEKADIAGGSVQYTTMLGNEIAVIKSGRNDDELGGYSQRRSDKVVICVFKNADFAVTLMHELLETAMVIHGNRYNESTGNTYDFIFLMKHGDFTVVSAAVCRAYNDIMKKFKVKL